MKKTNKVLLLAGVFCCMVTAFAFGAANVNVKEASAESTAAFSGSFEEEYGLNETIILPEFNLANDYVINMQTYEEDTLKILETYENPQSVKYTFEELGTHVISYIYELDDASLQAYNYTVNVVEKAVFDISAFPQTAYIGNAIDFGAVKLIYQGKSKTADVLVIDPAGNVFDVSNGVFAPTSIGEYKFSVSTTLNGQYYSKNFSVDVVADASALFESETASFISDYDLPSWSPSGNGVLVTTTTAGSKVRYSNVIDISKLTSDIPVIEFQALFGKDETTGYTFGDMGQRAAADGALQVKLIDAYDENKFITFIWRSNEWFLYNNPYGKVSSFTGTSPNKYPVPKWAGYFEGKTEFYSTFRGAEAKAFDGRTGVLFNFSMDYETNSSYMYTTAVDTSASKKYFITSYADKDKYGNEAFDKFTTGECYLEIKFPEYWYDGNRYGLVVTSVAGNSLSGMSVNDMDKVNDNSFVDDVKPAINLDLDKDYMENMPTGYVGVPYPVPSAYALDNISGECQVYCGVTEETTKTKYAVRKGVFTPDRAGEYKITYTTTDAYGNIDTVVLSVTVKDEAVPKIDFAFTEEVIAKYKSEIVMPKITVSGGSGKIDYSYKLYYNDVEVDTTKPLRLSELGILKFVFTAQDYLGTEIGNEGNALILNVVETDDLFITMNDFVPKYVKQNTTVVFPDFTVDSASANEIVKTIKVNGVALGADRTYTVTGETGSDLKIEYVADNGKEFKQTFTAEVIPNSDDVCELMVSDIDNAVLGQALDGGLIYQVSGDKYIASPQPICSDGFVLNANLDLTKLDTYTVSLYDCYDADKAVTFTFSALGTQVLMLVNGRTEYKFAPDATFADGSVNLYLNFDSKTGRLSNYKDVMLAYVTDYVNGETYEGFNENIAYASASFKGASDMTYTLLRLGNQIFGRYSNTLAIGPQISIAGDLMSQYINKGTTVIVPAAIGFDLFDGRFDVYVSVMAPDGSLVINGEIADTEKSFAANDYGIYKITYYSTDAHNGASETMFEYNVPEYIPPEISVDTTKIEAKVGEKFTIREATVTDNVTPSEMISLYAFIIDENNHYTMVSGEYSIDKAGEYTLVYVAVDLNGNIGRKTVTVVIK